MFYFTDGEAPAPENAKGNILWIISSVSGMNDQLPGHVIKLEL
jgi:predicted metal-dependent peptidase